MLFIMGITNGRKDFDHNQVMTCPICGAYGSFRVFMTYTVLSLFFIPTFKWGKRYYVETTCCNSIYELDPEVAPLVYILNEIGYVTTGSCCGHGLSVGWVHISFTDFKMLRELALIVYRDEFKSRFTLSTDSNVSNMGPTEIRLSLNTIAKGEQAYKDMSDLVVYLKSKKERLKRLRELKN